MLIEFIDDCYVYKYDKNPQRPLFLKPLKISSGNVGLIISETSHDVMFLLDNVLLFVNKQDSCHAYVA
jgi:hypothetical protein